MEVSPKPEQSNLAPYGPDYGNLTSIPPELISTDQLTTIPVCTHVVSQSLSASWDLFVLFGWFLNVLVNYEVISRTGPKTERMTIFTCCHT